MPKHREWHIVNNAFLNFSRIKRFFKSFHFGCSFFLLLTIIRETRQFIMLCFSLLSVQVHKKFNFSATLLQYVSVPLFCCMRESYE
jgi:hypothetical protein